MRKIPQSAKSFLFRGLLTLFLIFFLSFAGFALIDAMPGDPLDVLVMSNPGLTSLDVERLRHLYGADQPLISRYLNWAASAIQGDFGFSRTYRIPVTELFFPRLGNTLLLGGLALAFALTVGLPLGVMSALRPNTWASRFSAGVANFSLSVPSFWLGLMLILFFSVKLHWFPVGGSEASDAGASLGEGLLSRLHQMALPVLSLGIQQLGIYILFARTSFVEILKLPSLRTAKAKGAGRFRVLAIHAGKNAALPLIPTLAINLSSLLSGATITEAVFGYQGVGRLVYDSILANDHQVAMVSVLFTVSGVLIFNWLAESLALVIDPRRGSL